MENKFYSRATGKLSKTSHKSFTDRDRSKKDSSTIYSIEDSQDDSRQYPTEILSISQKWYIEMFLRSISCNLHLSIDVSVRGVHWMGLWKCNTQNITLSVSLSQPHITNATIHLKGLSIDVAKNHARDYFPSRDNGGPYISPTKMYFTVMGKYAIPFVDSLVEYKLIESRNISWTMIVLSQTQPIFTIILDTATYECAMTHGSCAVLSESIPESARISHPISNSQNFSFRSSSITEGLGSGPSITIHASGILQYNGSPRHIETVTSSFRDCISSIMKSDYATKFIKSLVILREID